MNCAGRQSHGQAVDTEIRASKHDVADSVVVRQHADDDLAVEQVGDIRRGIEPERYELAHLVRATDIRDHPPSGGGEICGHRRAHVAKTDEADVSLHRPAAV